MLPIEFNISKARYRNQSCLMQTFSGSEKNPRLHAPPSRPTPEFLTPPNGVLKSRCNQVLTQMIPVSILCAISCARFVSPDHTEPASPYSVEFAISIASSSYSNRWMVTTGPKISSVEVRELLSSQSMTVGLKNAHSEVGPTCPVISRVPPVRIVPPSSIPS